MENFGPEAMILLSTRYNQLHGKLFLDLSLEESGYFLGGCALCFGNLVVGEQVE